MNGTVSFLQPNGLKLILAATLVVPCLFIVLIAGGFDMWEPLVPVAVAIVLAYVAACIVDHLVQSRTVKIAVASVAALTSIILGSLLVRSMTMICDPVHDPGMICDPVHVPENPEPVVIATVQSPETTPIICDPVHAPAVSGSDAAMAVPGVLTGHVAEKLDECRKKCGR